MITKPRNAPVKARMGFPTGQSNVGVIIHDGPDTIGDRVTAIELSPGIWEAELTAPGITGDYVLIWDADGDLYRHEELVVTGSTYIPGTGEVEEDPLEDRQAAKLELTMLVMPEAEPVLDDAQMESLLDFAQRADSEGRAPGHDDWIPTYDLNAAAAEGWKRKAGLAASMFDFAEDDQRFNVGQVHNHCVAMANSYRNRAGRSVRVGLATD